MALTRQQKQRLTALAGSLLTMGVPNAARVKRIKAGLAPLVDAVDQVPTTDARERQTLATVPPMNRLDTASAVLRKLLVRLLGTPKVEEAWRALPADQRRDKPLRPGAGVLTAAARLAADPQPNPADEAVVNDWLTEKGNPAMPVFEAEQRGLPAGFDEQAFVDRVAEQLDELNFPQNQFPAFHAVVVGKLLLQGITDPDRSGFGHAVRWAYNEGIAATTGRRQRGQPVNRIKNYETYTSVADDLDGLHGGDPIRYQELASITDYVVAGADDWPVDDDTTRRTQVVIGLTRYVDGTADTGFSALDLPDIVSEDASQQEIERPNVEAVAMLAAAAEIEQAMAFDAVDTMLGEFLQGTVPVRDDGGGRALDRYHWDSEDRLDAAARAQQYARIVGYGGGGAAPPDVHPNTGFHDLLLRMVSSLVRYDSDLQIANVVAIGRRENVGSAEYVRKAAHDLLANASLYGWGFTIFAARRIKRHLDQVFDVLGQESLQRAYGVTGPWQLVERVTSLHSGATPNVVVHRTRAKATKDTLDILARYAPELSKSGAGGRFLPSAAEIGAGVKAPGTIMELVDYDALVTAANNLLAVEGVAEEDVYRLAQPVRSPLAPSIPTIGGNGGGSGNGGDALDQIRQLVAQGQTPTLEQLQRLVPVGGGVG